MRERECETWPEEHHETRTSMTVADSHFPVTRTGMVDSSTAVEAGVAGARNR